MKDETIETHPVQLKHQIPRDRPKVPAVVTRRAYEVYCELYGEQPAIVTGDCRGGFAISEIIGFLYAYPFPRAEWRKRVEEAWKGMESL